LTIAAHETVLHFRWPVDLALTIASHGWGHLAPWRWDAETGRLSRTERVGSRIGTLAVEQSDPSAVAVRWGGFSAADETELLNRVRRWLSVEWEPSAAMAALPEAAALIERGGGRMLRGSSFYEDFVKTVLTINTSWSATCRMVAALVAEPGDGAFPGPEALLDYGEERLRERAKLGFRARTIALATRGMLDDGAIAASGEGQIERLEHDYLMSLKGIGPMLQLIAECCCTISAVSRSIRSSPRICASGTIAIRRHSQPTGRHGATISRAATASRGSAKGSNQTETSGGKSPGSIPNLTRSATIHSRIRPSPRLSSNHASTTPRKRRSSS